MGYSQIVNNMTQHGFSRVYVPGISHIANSAMNGFKEFLREPEEIRRLWTFQNNIPGFNSEVGYLPRDKPINEMTGYAYDHKDVFHFRSQLLKKLGGKMMPYLHKCWLGDLAQLYQEALNLGMYVAEELTKLFPDSHIMHGVSRSTLDDDHVLRLLHYHMIEREGGLIGLGHTDESFLTVHVADNFPGLKVGEEGDTELVPTARNICLVYPGKKAELHTGGEIKALWHEIVDTRPEIPNLQRLYNYTETGSPDIHRMAIVFFLDSDT